MNRTVLSALALFSLSACLAPPQDFPVGSDFWNRANPEFVGLADAERTNARHRVLVAVLDAGTDYNAPALRKHIHVFAAPTPSGRPYGVGYDTLGIDFFPSYQIINRPAGEDLSGDMDLREHGTHVAQLVTLNDPAIGLLPVRVMPLSDPGRAPGAPPADPVALLMNQDAEVAQTARRMIDSIERGLEFAVEHGAMAANMSIGMDLADLKAPHLEQTLDYLDRHLTRRMRTDWRDTLMVAAAGNERTPLFKLTQSMPATLPVESLLSVGALSAGARPGELRIAFYSNYGAYVDVYVRGSDIKSAVPAESNPAGTRTLSGTSMAAPIAAHLAAQLKVIAPTLSPAELRALIINTADSMNLPFEDVREGITLHAPATPRTLRVRVLNAARARRVARTLGNAADADRTRWLTPPYLHGHAE